MKIIQAPRASAILYTLLSSQNRAKPWLLPANICPIVPITFMKARVPFEFVDISAETLHMDLDRVEAKMMRKRELGGFLYVHTYGDESTPEDFFAQAKSLNPEMLVVDDRCLCIPSFDANSSADVVLFSTGHAKVIELEFGGYALLRENVKYHPVPLPFHLTYLAELEKQYKSDIRARIRFDYRDSDWLLIDSELPDWNVYCQQIEAGLASSLAQRKTLNEIYSSRLPKEIRLHSRYQTWRFNIRVKNKIQMMKAIFNEKLFASSHYASLAGIMSEGRAPVAESLADEVINLFNDHHFDVQRAERICEIILACES